MGRSFLFLCRIAFLLILFTITLCTSIHFYMVFRTQNHKKSLPSSFLWQPSLIANSSPTSFAQKEYALVLGASVKGKTLSYALKTRMDAAITLYQQHWVKYLLLSGTGIESFYDETTPMAHYAHQHGIPKEHILIDNQGNNTYATMLRAATVFHVKSAYIVTQPFHTVRAVWIARYMNIDADAIDAAPVENTFYYSVREFFAQMKDFLQTIVEKQAA